MVGTVFDEVAKRIMSYDIRLADAVSGETIEIDDPHFMRGGTYQVGGSTYLSLNVTYNYHGPFEKALGPAGIYAIYGLTGLESIPVLEAAIGRLGNDVSEDYWASTEGNAKQALVQLLTMAKMRPDGVWNPDEADDPYVAERKARAAEARGD